jgi:hypothetical protein
MEKAESNHVVLEKRCGTSEPHSYFQFFPLPLFLSHMVIPQWTAPHSSACPITSTPNANLHEAFTLKTAAAMFAETAEHLENSMWLTPKRRSYTLHFSNEKIRTKFFIYFCAL